MAYVNVCRRVICYDYLGVSNVDLYCTQMPLASGTLLNCVFYAMSVTQDSKLTRVTGNMLVVDMP